MHMYGNEIPIKSLSSIIFSTLDIEYIQNKLYIIICEHSKNEIPAGVKNQGG